MQVLLLSKVLRASLRRQKPFATSSSFGPARPQGSLALTTPAVFPSNAQLLSPTRLPPTIPLMSLPVQTPSDVHAAPLARVQWSTVPSSFVSTHLLTGANRLNPFMIGALPPARAPWTPKRAMLVSWKSL